MNSTIIRLILVATFLGQFAFVLLLHSNSEKYRQLESDKAYKAYILSNTPENKAEWDSEYKLQQQHQTLIELIWIAGLLVNGLTCYKFCNFGVMKLEARIFISICWGVLIVFGVLSNCPEYLEPALVWSLPLFHKFFLPLESGPNPIAYLCASAIDVIILATITFILISIKQKENKESSTQYFSKPSAE
jgi:hypothetical protein